MASVNKCAGCGAVLDGGGKSGKVTCPYCGTVNKVEKEPTRADAIVSAVCGSENELDAQHCSQRGRTCIHLPQVPHAHHCRRGALQKMRCQPFRGDQEVQVSPVGTAR